jgi:Ser/Thr protein kinase RdoA (MazF antagonist)
MIHMDLHPKNVMIYKEKNKYCAKILDLGLSCNNFNNTTSVALSSRVRK